jgi:glycosyltransferase involved in cell wall biosynthesis
MCDAFVEAGEEVIYMHGKGVCEGKKVTWDDVAEYYGLKNRFSIKTFRNLYLKTGRFTKIGTMSMAGPMATYVLLEVLAGRLGNEDVIFGREYYPLYFLTEFFKLVPDERCPDVYFEHHDPQKKRFETRFHSQIDGLVSTTEGLAELMTDQYPITRDRILVEPNGVDRRSYDEIAQVDARNRLNIPSDETLVVYTGHLFPDKGGETLVEAARGLDATIYLVGGYPDDVDRVKRDAGNPDNVVFTGFVDPSKIPLYQLAADVLVAPHTEDAPEILSPLKMFEYLAAERPIVASDWGTIREILTDNENALLFPCGDSDALRAAIERVLTSEGLADRLVTNARETAEYHTWERRAERVLSFVHGSGQA